MFTTIISISDSQLTGLSVQQAFVLLSSPVKATNTTKKQMKNSQVSTPLLA
jgi:hypothetical protein